MHIYFLGGRRAPQSSGLQAVGGRRRSSWRRPGTAANSPIPRGSWLLIRWLIARFRVSLAVPSRMLCRRAWNGGSGAVDVGSMPESRWASKIGIGRPLHVFSPRRPAKYSTGRTSTGGRAAIAVLPRQPGRARRQLSSARDRPHRQDYRRAFSFRLLLPLSTKETSARDRPGCRSRRNSSA